MSRTFWYGASNGMSFHRSTMTFDDVPIPSTNRPGAAAAIVAADIASVAGPRVYTGMIATPSRNAGAQTLASASGVKPVVCRSTPPTTDRCSRDRRATR